MGKRRYVMSLRVVRLYERINGHPPTCRICGRLILPGELTINTGRGRLYHAACWELEESSAKDRLDEMNEKLDDILDGLNALYERVETLSEELRNLREELQEVTEAGKPWLRVK